MPGYFGRLSSTGSYSQELPRAGWDSDGADSGTPRCGSSAVL